MMTDYFDLMIGDLDGQVGDPCAYENIAGDGCGAIKADADTYRVVYFAFGFEAINNSVDRDTMMSRVMLWFDTTPPTISITSPTNGQMFSTSTITVTGNASDNIALSKVELKVNSGSWQTATGTTSWNKSTTIAPGSNTIYVRAIDASENTNEKSITVTYNPPTFDTGSGIYPTKHLRSPQWHDHTESRYSCNQNLHLLACRNWRACGIR